MKRNKKWMIVTALALALLTACAAEQEVKEAPAEDAAAQSAASEAQTDQAEQQDSQDAEQERKGVLEEFAAEDLEGNPVDGSLFHGYEINMINVWATYCSPCIREMPGLGELAAEYADRGVQIVGIVSDLRTQDGYDPELTELAKEIATATGANYVHLMPSDDLTMRILSQIQSVPTTFFVDENGRQIGGVLLGARDKDAWAAVLDQMLEEVE